MNDLFDALLPQPLPGFLYHSLEFIFFVLHFFFVLVTVGTMFFAVLVLARRFGGRERNLPVDPEHDKTSSSLPVYFASKSLMITFGIAVLLLVMAFYSVPFTNASNLHGGWWIGIIFFLSAALIVFEVFDRRIKKPGQAKTATLLIGTAGLALILVVPGIFVTFVVTAENPQLWPAIFHGGVLSTPLAGHWLARLLHVYGAAVVIAGMFYAIYTARTGRRSPVTPGVLFGALMVQIVLGILLYMSMPSPPDTAMNAFVLLGAAGAVFFAWLMFSGKTKTGGKYLLPSAVALILIPMLLARQLHQERVLVPFNAQLKSNAAAYRKVLASFATDGENPFFTEKYDAYNLPQFIFQRSCVFCHGGVGNGQGREAANLSVPPADLTQVRTHPDDLLAVLRKGVPGSAMPYFSVYTGGALKGLSGYLYDKVGIKTEVEPVTFPTTADDDRTAVLVFGQQCAACHGRDGKVSEQGKKLRPAPTDMTRWALAPALAFRIISEGNPGTSMQGYGQLAEPVRWALVKLSNGFYAERQNSKRK